MLALIHFLSFVSTNISKVRSAFEADEYRSLSTEATTETLSLSMEVSRWYSLVHAGYVTVSQSRPVRLNLLGFQYALLGAQPSGAHPGST